MQFSSLFPRLLLALTVAATDLEVDLGYQVYRGVLNSTTGIKTWSGIRFAAPPVGALRWQAPQPPESNRSAVADATAYGSTCIQNAPAPGGLFPITNTDSSEDCLFLNVQAPAGAVQGSLPVLVWIHGGGYGAGSGRQDMSEIINANKGAFVAVSIQYRLGAFGFLSSDEIYRRGKVNAGILDQQFALKWVQANIGLFGGNASQVTISGESVRVSSVLLAIFVESGVGASLNERTQRVFWAIHEWEIRIVDKEKGKRTRREKKFSDQPKPQADIPSRPEVAR